jgi:Lipoprotein LpqB beta-propeller domain/Sporulation and spore germination
VAGVASEVVRPRRRWLAAGVALLLALALSACATIPTSGAVHQGRDLAQEPDPQLPRSLGRDPVPSDGPEATVRGFLQSGADFLDDHKYAREYLASAVRSRWNPGKGTSVYDRAAGLSVVIESGSTSALVTSTEVARIDADGRYQRMPDEIVQRRFGLSHAGGRWRINSLDNGLLLSSSDVDTAYRQLNLYFLAPTSHTVVPDPVLLPDLPGLTTKLMTRLLEGPTEPLRGAVESAFPQGTRLEVASVPVRDGLATVRLDTSALRGDADARVGMSAQIVWTLRQLPDIDRIRILADGDDLVTSGVPREQPRSAWPSFDPDILGATSGVYVVREGRVGRLTGKTFTPVRGAAGTVRPSVDRWFRRPAISLDGTRIAVTNTKSTALYIGRLANAAPLVAVPLAPGAVVSPPSWDSSGDLWFIDRTTDKLEMFGGENPHVSTVPMPKLAEGPLQIVRVSREGTRVALAVGAGTASHLFLGSIVRGPDGGVQAVAGVHEVLPDVQGVRDIAWIDADTLIVVGNRGEQAPVALLTDADGFEVDDSIDPLRGIDAMVGAPPDTKLPLVASTDAGQLQQWSPSVGWQPLGEGRDPIYPG